MLTAQKRSGAASLASARLGFATEGPRDVRTEIVTADAPRDDLFASLRAHKWGLHKSNA
jgi:hypothetical protein